MHAELPTTLPLECATALTKALLAGTADDNPRESVTHGWNLVGFAGYVATGGNLFGDEPCPVQLIELAGALGIAGADSGSMISILMMLAPLLIDLIKKWLANQ
jgi:hypothetical protein